MENLFLRDTLLGVTHEISSATAAPGTSAFSMTADGGTVAFVSGMAGHGNLFVWNSTAGGPTYSNSGNSISNVTISPNGQRVAYLSSTLSVADLVLGTNWNLTASAFNLHPGLQFSADGNLLAYSTATSVASNDLNGTYDVYLYNFLTGSNLLVSFGHNSGNAAAGQSDSPVISPDGRFIVYRSFATNLVPSVTNGLPALFIYDRTTGANALFSKNLDKTGPANSHSDTPVFSGDGRRIVFESWASDLALPLDFNASANVYEYSFPYLSLTWGFSGPLLAWPETPGQNYQVQYSDDLDELKWLNLPESIITNGNQASVTDTSASGSQRFYRLIVQ